MSSGTKKYNSWQYLVYIWENLKAPNYEYSENERG